MATTTTTAATAAAKATAPKAKAKAAAPKAATTPAAAPAPQAPLFTMGPWPAKSRGGNSVRAYCYTVAAALAKAQPQGFTLAQLASAFAASANGTTNRQPSAGWGSAAKPNGTARQHANWFAHASQGWLAPAGQ